jgi:hypothetical protein
VEYSNSYPQGVGISSGKQHQNTSKLTLTTQTIESQIRHFDQKFFVRNKTIIRSFAEEIDYFFLETLQFTA